MDKERQDELEKRRLALEEQEAALRLERQKLEEKKVTPRVFVAAQKQPSFVSDTICSIADELAPFVPKREITGIKTHNIYN